MWSRRRLISLTGTTAARYLAVWVFQFQIIDFKAFPFSMAPSYYEVNNIRNSLLRSLHQEPVQPFCLSLSSPPPPLQTIFLRHFSFWWFNQPCRIILSVFLSFYWITILCTGAPICNEKSRAKPNRCGGCQRNWHCFHFDGASIGNIYVCIKYVIFSFTKANFQVQDMINKIDDGSATLDFKV